MACICRTKAKIETLSEEHRKKNSLGLRNIPSWAFNFPKQIERSSISKLGARELKAVFQFTLTLLSHTYPTLLPTLTRKNHSTQLTIPS